MKPEDYSLRTATMRVFNCRKICSTCKQSQPQLGGKSIAKPNSGRKIWVCKGCST